jgi:ankyrin repeat protein
MCRLVTHLSRQTGQTALVTAVAQEQAQSVAALVEGKASVNYESSQVGRSCACVGRVERGRQGETALLLASRTGKLDLCKQLVELKADVAAKSKVQLAYACLDGCIGPRRARLWVPAQSGETAVSVAASDEIKMFLRVAKNRH